MKNFPFIKCLAFMLASFSLSAHAAETVKIFGSDIIGEKISGDIKKNAEAMGIKLEVSMDGSRDGMEAMKKNTADIAIVAIPDGQELPTTHMLVPYVHQAAIILVNSQNPIEEISISQLAQIFGTVGEKTETWQQFGLNNTMSLRNIYPISTNLQDNLAVELFKNKCLNNSNLSPSVELKANSSLAADSVRTSGNAIAIVSKNPNIANVKAIGVGKAAGTGNTQSFKPTPENIQNGDYPLTLHFYLMYKPENAKKLRPILQLLLSDNTAKLLEDAGLMPAPKNFRKSYSLELDIAK